MDNKSTEFGKTFIKQVRDLSLFYAENLITDEMKGEGNQEFYERTRGMSEEQIQVFKDFSYRVVDIALHHMLVMFDQSKSWVISNPKEGVESLADISDGLAGELYSSEDWIELFSKYSPSIK